MMKKLALAAVLLCPGFALGQSIIQSGSVTPGHAVMWTTNGVVQDAGTAAQGLLTSIGVTASGPAICQNSGPITGPYNQICLDVTSIGGGLSLTNNGGATGGFTFTLNGVPQALGGGLVIGSSTITGGVNGQCVYDNAGIAGVIPCGSTGTLTVGTTVVNGGSLNQCLTIAAGPVLGSASCGSGGSPGGSNNSVQINSSSSFGGIGPTAGAIVNWNGSGVPAATINPVIGVPGSTTGSLALANGTGGGAEVIQQNLGATSSYNWNYPTTAGTSGTPLISKGGASTSMAWGTVSGNTTEFATVNGALVSGNCVESDSSHNLVDAGAACGSGGGSVPTPEVQDFVAPGGFTPGSTTSLTLSSAPAASAGTFVFFDLANQSADTWSLSGSTITFSQAIPASVQVVEVHYNQLAGGSVVVNSGASPQLAYYAGSSAISGAADTGISGGVLTLGAASSVQGGVALEGSGSGLVTIQPGNAAAGTYSFLLPTTAGALGQPMISGAGSAAMTFGTLQPVGGGTGLATMTANILYRGNGTNPMLPSAIGDTGSLILVNEPVDLTSKPLVEEVANNSATGTFANLLAKLTGAPSTAVVTATTDTAGAIGVVISGAGTGGVAQVAIAGQASCVFDGATTAGDYVAISATAAGNCHDAGATYPTTGQVLGRVLSTNVTVGTYGIQIFGPEIRASAGGGGITGPGSSVKGGYPVWNVTTGATVLDGKGSCNVLAFGAVYALVGGTDVTSQINAAIAACGSIYIPAPDGGQSYDSNGFPQFCLNVSSTLTFNGTLNGGIRGDGPSVSCINSTNTSACVVGVGTSQGALFENVLFRHSGSSFSSPGCGFDGGMSSTPFGTRAINVWTYNNYIGAILSGGQILSGYFPVWTGGLIAYSQNDGIYNSTTQSNGGQWYIVGGTVVTNSGADGIHMQCENASLTPNTIDTVTVQYSGNYSYEVDSSICPVENFRLSNSWGGESGLDQIYIHGTNAAGVFTSIDNVYLESPGFACLAGTYFNNCNQSTPAGSFSGGHCTSNTAIGLVDQANDHLTVSHMKEYGCGGNAAGGAFISGPTIWSIDHSEFTANVGYGLFANAGAGSLEGNVFQGNGGNGIAAATGIVALSTHGNIVYTNTAGNLSVGTISNLSNSGDWCGSSATSLAACVW